MSGVFFWSTDMTALAYDAALPLLVVAAAAVVLLAVEAIQPGSGRRHGPRLAVVVLAASIVLSLLDWPGSGSCFFGMLAVTGFSLFFWILFAVVALLVVALSDAYATQWFEAVGSGDYYILLLIATSGLMLMTAAANLVVMFLGLEVVSVSAYVLVGIPRERALANEAALKYLLLGAFASAFLLYGIALLYGATGTLDISLLAMRAAPQPADVLLLCGVALLVVGLGFKAALVPFHMWAPDVYQGAPTAISAFMSVGPKAAALAVLAKILMGALPGLSPRWSPLLWTLAVLSMTVGNVMALAQTDIKRMLAYSSVAHAGYALVALVAASPAGREALLYYLAAYAFMNVGAFGVVLYVASGVAASGEEGTTLSDYAGLGWQAPLLGVAMATFMFGLAGIPPTAGFAAKFYAFSSAVDAGYIGLAVVGVLNSLLSVYFYLRVTVFMYMREPGPAARPLNPPPGIGLAVAACLVATLALGLFPQHILQVLRQSVVLLP
ncbi:MAG: NADH-quinone oxidoreductase subunit N [Pseudomonadota bacterium]